MVHVPERLEVGLGVLINISDWLLIIYQHSAFHFTRISVN